MPNIPKLEEMLEAGLHFGHRTSYWHPKMEPYIFDARNNVHVIDLETTQTMLKDALDYVKRVASRGGKVLFVGTKSQAKPIIKKQAEECGMPYVTERWLGGTFTNFSQIKKSIDRLKKLKKQRDKGELRKYTKKERLLILREIEDMEEKIGGIQDLTSLPDAVFVADVRQERTAVEEAIHTGLKVVAVCDTNANPKGVDYIIPANDDAVKSIEMVTELVAEAVKEGRKANVKDAAKDQKKKGKKKSKKKEKKSKKKKKDKNGEE
jgi:small subunit ribosomal protein S2